MQNLNNELERVSRDRILALKLQKQKEERTRQKLNTTTQIYHENTLQHLPKLFDKISQCAKDTIAKHSFYGLTKELGFCDLGTFHTDQDTTEPDFEFQDSIPNFYKFRKELSPQTRCQIFSSLLEQHTVPSPHYTLNFACTQHTGSFSYDNLGWKAQSTLDIRLRFKDL